MIVGRRHLSLAICFLTLAFVITGDRVRAQPSTNRSRNQSSPFIAPLAPLPPFTIPHEIWGGNLDPDQFKKALSRIGQGAGDSDTDQLLERLRDYFEKQDPETGAKNPQIEQAIKNIIGNPKLMEELKAIAKQKQSGQNGSGASEEEIAKLLKSKYPDGLFSPTDQSSNTEQPNKTSPSIQQQPVSPKTSGFQNNVKKIEGRNNPLELNKKGSNEQINPMLGGKEGEFSPPMNLGNLGNFGKMNPLDGKNPFGPPVEPSDPRSKSLAALAAMWESNIGPLDDTPEVKRALFDIVSGENGFDFDIKDDKGNSLWDLLKNGSGDNSSLSDTLNGGSGNWKMPDFDLPSVGWSKWFDSSPSTPSSSGPSTLSSHSPSSSSTGSGFGGFGGGLGDFDGSWLPVALLGVVISGALLTLWWYLRDPIAADDGLVGSRFGPWPVDPRAINTREDVVKAFEYLSVLICGVEAKMWTHGTIAVALSDLATTHGETAVKLARLYELARYAPLDESLSRDELIEARHIICDLAGVS